MSINISDYINFLKRFDNLDEIYTDVIRYNTLNDLIKNSDNYFNSDSFVGKIYILIFRMYFINSIFYEGIYKIYKEIIIYGKINIELFRTILNNKEADKSILKIDVKSLIFKNIKNLNLRVISYYYYCLVEKSIDYENDGYLRLKKEYFYKFKKIL